MATYTDVQFIGYALPTIPLVPLSLEWIGNGAEYVEGRYIGIDPAAADIDARILLIQNALAETMASGAVDPSESTLKIFVMPEFTLRGTQGAYDDGPPPIDYFTYFRTEFARRVAAPAGKGWLFVVGTFVSTVGYVRGQDHDQDRKARRREDFAVALAASWQFATAVNDSGWATVASNALNQYTVYCRANPIYWVTDTSYVVAGGFPHGVWREGLSVQKEYFSNEDFVLNYYPGVFGEDCCAYPPINESNGEDKQTAWDPFGIFTIEGIRFGLEVCLDHLCSRLRNNRQPDTELVQIQLVPSCGAYINQPAIIAGAGGYVFNCDGEYGGQQPSSDYIWVGAADDLAHTQLTQIVSPCSKGKSGTNAAMTAPSASVTVVPIIDPLLAKMLYAYGAGEVHVYSPLPVPPPVI